MVSRSTQVVVGMADAVMVAHLGADALAAVTTGSLNAFAALIFPMGVVFVVGSFSAQLAGMRAPLEARRYALYGLVVAALAQGLVLVLLPLLASLLAHLDYSPEVAEILRTYLSIRLLSIGAAVGIEALGAFYGGLGDTRLMMRVNLAAMLLNVVLNALLIDGRLGLPALGVEGAAWASTVATTTSFAGFLLVFLREPARARRGALRLAEFLRLLRIGVPSGLNWSFEYLAFVVFINVVVADFGTVSLAAMMAVMQLNACSFMPAFGLASAGAILVGQALGGMRHAEVPSILGLTFLVSAAWMGAVGLAYLLFPGALLGPFLPRGVDAADFIALASGMLTFSALWQLFDAAGITISEALRSAGDTSFTMWTRAVLAWGLLVPGSLAVVRGLGGRESAALACVLIYLALLSLVLWWRFAGGSWREIRLVDPHRECSAEVAGPG